MREDTSEKGRAAALSNERYRTFVEEAGEGVYEVDIHGNLLYFNESLCRIFGRRREALQFQNFARFMDEENAKAAFEAFNRIYRDGGGVTDLVWKIVDGHGRPRVVELSASLITNQEGEKVGFRGIARDITEKYEAQEALKQSEKRYKTLLDFVPYPIVVFTLDGRVSYLNPAFTETFGWTLDELAGKTIPYVPQGLERETSENIERLFRERIISRHETRRLTKDGRVLDVVMRAAVYSEEGVEPTGELVIFRDITEEKRIARNNEAMLRISMALPAYPDLEELLTYISGEVKRLLGTEGALVILLDEERQELFFQGVTYDDSATQKRVREIRFSIDQLVAGKVIRSGEPMIVADTSEDAHLHQERDRKLGYHTRNLLLVPLRSGERVIGVLSAINKKEGGFGPRDSELLSMIAGTVALSIENARFSEELKKAYREVSELNKAKDKAINHLSHELKTPAAVLSACLRILEKKLAFLPEASWKTTLERAVRNLDRILEIQEEVDDIMRDRVSKPHTFLSQLLERCADELEALVAEETGEGPLVQRIRARIDDIFGAEERRPEKIRLDRFVAERLKSLEGALASREVDVRAFLEPVPEICIPADPLGKIVGGLIRNAVENTPDQGRVEVRVRALEGDRVELEIQDYGVGIPEEYQRRIFEGFFATQETMDYSSKRAFEFNAGGKGADLLRMKIFSERYGFRIGMQSLRCRFIPRTADVCPGRIRACPHCHRIEDCHGSGGSRFWVRFGVGQRCAKAVADQAGAGNGDLPREKR